MARVMDVLMRGNTCCLGFFWFMRAGEFTCSSPGKASSSSITVSDVWIDSSNNLSPGGMFATQQDSGAHLYQGCKGNILCPELLFSSTLNKRWPPPSNFTMVYSPIQRITNHPSTRSIELTSPTIQVIVSGRCRTSGFQ